MRFDRLRNVVKALVEAEGGYDQGSYRLIGIGEDGVEHSCGSPGCAFGHYVSRPDLQSEFMFSGGDVEFTDPDRQVEFVGTDEIGVHFEMPWQRAREIFSTGGCDFADRDKSQAIAYIQDFIERHEKALALA